MLPIYAKQSAIFRAKSEQWLVVVADEDCPGHPGRLSALSVFLCKLVLYGAFVWVRRALNNQNGGFRPGQWTRS